MKTRYLTLTLALALAVAATPCFAGAKTRSSAGGRSGGGSRSVGAVSRHSGPSRAVSSPRSGGAIARHPGGTHGRIDSGHRYYRGGHNYGRHNYRPSYYGYWGWPYGYYGYYGLYDGWYPGYWGGYYGWGPRPYYSVHVRSYGSIRLQVHPKDAEVLVDGGYAGTVDDFDGIFQRLHVRPGRHELTFRCEGYKTHHMRAYAPFDGTLRIRYEMERGPSNEETSSVVGRPSDDDPEEDAPAIAAGSDSDRDDEAEETDEPAAEAAPRPATAEVKLEVQPADAAVYIDGKFAGNADDVDDLRLPPGRHRIEVVRPGRTTFEKDIEVSAGQSLVLKVALDKTTES